MGVPGDCSAPTTPCVPGPLVSGTTIRQSIPDTLAGGHVGPVCGSHGKVTAPTPLGRCTACSILQPLAHRPLQTAQPQTARLSRPQRSPPRPGSLHVMYPGMAGRMNCHQQQSLRKGSRCESDSWLTTKCGQCQHLFGRTNTAQPLTLVLRKQRNGWETGKKLALGHVVNTTRSHE